jgi:uncharacterized protein (DUF2267 family)
VRTSAAAPSVVDTVRHRLGAVSRRDAEATTIIVLRALCERLSIGLSSRLSEILPGQLARRLRGIAAAGTRFSPVGTYLTEVAEAGHVSPTEAGRQAMAVFAALAEVLPEDVLAQIAAEVPWLHDLFRRGPSTTSAVVGDEWTSGDAARAFPEPMPPGRAAGSAIER